MEEVEGLFKQNAVMIRQSSMELQPFLHNLGARTKKKLNLSTQLHCFGSKHIPIKKITAI